MSTATCRWESETSETIKADLGQYLLTAEEIDRALTALRESFAQLAGLSAAGDNVERQTS